MIETREQYEEIRKGWHFAGSNSQVVAVNTDLVEIIEALRDGPRLLEISPDDGEYIFIAKADVMKFLNSLPDWLVQND